MTGHGKGASPGITVRLLGGLGNQLFIYATGRALADRLGCSLSIDVGAFTTTPRHGTPRQFELEWLVEEEIVVHHQSSLAMSRYLYRLQGRSHGPDSSSHFQEEGFAYDQRIENVKPGTTLRGYFQSWKYFQAIASQFRSDIFSRAPTSDWQCEQRRLLDKLSPWIGLHVRQGDYLEKGNRRHHGVLSASYYREALQRMPNQDQMPLVIFSDDPEGAKQIIEPIRPIDHLVSFASNVSPIQHLVLMSAASRLVIANSSFGWWGAWLASPACELVIAPNPWFAHKREPEADLLLPHWVSNKSDFEP